MKKNEKEKKEEESKEVLSEVTSSADVKIPTEKEKLEALYKQLKDLGVNSIGDLEVKISRCQ